MAKVAHKSWSALSKKTGIDHHHHHLYAGRQGQDHFRTSSPSRARIITAPTWSASSRNRVLHRQLHQYPRAYPLPRSGRAHFFTRITVVLDFGEGFCAFKPPVDLKGPPPCPPTVKGKPHLTLSWITPHSKWGIHSSYQDNLRMLTLFRGGPHVWVAGGRRQKSIGIEDNDWVEAINANDHHGPAVVSQRVPVAWPDVPRPREEQNVPGIALHRQARRHPQLGDPRCRQSRPTWSAAANSPMASTTTARWAATATTGRPAQVEDQSIDWLERPLTPEREAQRNPRASARSNRER